MPTTTKARRPVRTESAPTRIDRSVRALTLCLGLTLTACEDRDTPLTGDSSINGVSTTMDDTRVELGSLTIFFDNRRFEFLPSDLKNIELLDFTSSELAFETETLGFPQPTGTDDDIPPTNDTRALVLEDFALNTVLYNIGVSAGITFRFVDSSGNPSPITNAEGPDILLIELGPRVGGTVPGPPPSNIQVSDGGDPFTLRGVGPEVTRTADFGPQDYTELGTTGIASGISVFSNVPPMMPADPIASLAELESTPLNFVEVTDLNLFGVLIDLTDLGYPAGATVSQMQLLSLGDEFSVDPALIVGLH
ncbi:MAG: hypothetical protein AAF196_16780 [Planctomycetota bacterium]